jgi:chromosome segregation ATPase
MNESKTPRTDECVKASLAENGGQYMAEDLLFKCREIGTENAELKRQVDSLSEELQLAQSKPAYDYGFDNGARAVKTLTQELVEKLKHQFLEAQDEATDWQNEALQSRINMDALRKSIAGAGAENAELKKAAEELRDELSRLQYVVGEEDVLLIEQKLGETEGLV